MSVVLAFGDNACALWVLMENGMRWEELLGDLINRQQSTYHAGSRERGKSW